VSSKAIAAREKMIQPESRAAARRSAGFRRKPEGRFFAKAKMNTL